MQVLKMEHGLSIIMMKKEKYKQKEEGNLSQIAENSEMVLQLSKKQANQDNNLKEIFKILDRISDRMTEYEVKYLETLDQRFEDHIRRFKHSMNCIDNGLRCNSS